MTTVEGLKDVLDGKCLLAKALMADYYNLRGWDQNGEPAPATLDRPGAVCIGSSRHEGLAKGGRARHNLIFFSIVWCFSLLRLGSHEQKRSSQERRCIGGNFKTLIDPKVRVTQHCVKK
ncbi:MAG: hypothetical protein KAR15_00270 [Desulfobacterales bacterium]|nr:hypothetical protein [Desulfobacterales bacterium]